jgi:hypothetical protein
MVAIVATATAFTLARSRREPVASGEARSGAPDVPGAPEKLGPRVHTTGATTARPTDPAPAIDHVAALRRGLSSPEEAVRIAAVEAAVSATAVETLADLQKFDLARDPETAPTVIHGVALLGASADGAKRDEAAKTLAGWLRDEMKRDGPDVPGNISNIVEALGDVGGREGVDALTAALDRADLALHVQTLAVEKLGELGDGRARASVERFAKRVAALPAADGIDEELREEATAAARATLAKI